MKILESPLGSSFILLPAGLRRWTSPWQWCSRLLICLSRQMSSDSADGFARGLSRPLPTRGGRRSYRQRVWNQKEKRSDLLLLFRNVLFLKRRRSAAGCIVYSCSFFLHILHIFITYILHIYLIFLQHVVIIMVVIILFERKWISHPWKSQWNSQDFTLNKVTLKILARPLS